jgi:hypothetical protein
MTDDAQPIETAPKDGSEVYIAVGGKARAYWDDELQAWVLSRPLHVESVRSPHEWWPVPPPRRIIGPFGYKDD